MTNHPPLPPGWVWTTIGEIRIDEGSSVTPKKLPDQIFELYSVPSFEDEKPEIVSGKEIGSSKRSVAKNTVLLCKINPRINRVWVVGDFTDHQKIASTEWIPFFPIRGIEPKYLKYFMNTSEFRDYLALNVSGVGGSLMRVKAATIIDYPFPLPPLPEQHRIVEAIETHFSRLEAGVASLRQAQARLKRYRASVLKAACEGRLVPQDPNDEPAGQLLERILQERRQRWDGRGKYKEPAPPDTSDLPALPVGWVWVTVEQLGTIGEQPVLTGPFGSNLGRSDFIDSGVTVLTIGCLTEYGLNREKAVYISESKAEELARYKVREGDLLFSRMATVGRAGFVTPEFQGAIINYHIMRLRLTDEAINPRFFIGYVRGSDTVSNYVREVNHGATRDGINTQQLLRMPVALPPLAEQQRIVAEVERRLSVVEEVGAAIEANLKRAERLRQAILKRAFAGKLAPQDPADEPALELLVRIRAAKSGGKRGRQLELPGV